MTRSSEASEASEAAEAAGGNARVDLATADAVTVTAPRSRSTSHPPVKDLTMSAPAMDQITDQLVRIPMESGQCWLWLDDEVTLIDSGARGSAPVIAAVLAELGLDRDALARVILTHHHIDHSGSAAELRGWGAQIWAHHADSPVVQGDAVAADPPLLPGEEPMWAQITGPTTPPPCPVDRQLSDGAPLPLDPGAVVVHTPGHTPGSIAIYLPGPRILFTGDTVATFGGTPILGPFNHDRTTAARSFRLLAALDSDIACPGHGDPITTDAGQRLRTLRTLGPYAA